MSADLGEGGYTRASTKIDLCRSIGFFLPDAIARIALDYLERTYAQKFHQWLLSGMHIKKKKRNYRCTFLQCNYSGFFAEKVDFLFVLNEEDEVVSIHPQTLWTCNSFPLGVCLENLINRESPVWQYYDRYDMKTSLKNTIDNCSQICCYDVIIPISSSTREQTRIMFAKDTIDRLEHRTKRPKK